MNEQPIYFVRTKKEELLKKWLHLAAWIVVVLATVVVIWTKTSGINPENIAFIEFCWQAVIATIGLLLVYSQIQEMAHSTESTLEWNMRVKSLEVVSNKAHYEHFKAIRDYREKNGEKSESGIKLLPKLPITINAELEHHVKEVANYLEIMAAGIKHGVYNEKMLYDTMGGMTVHYYNCFSDYLVEGHRKLNSTTAWIEFEELAKEWEAKHAADQKKTRTEALGRIK